MSVTKAMMPTYHPCPHCWRQCKTKGGLTQHIDKEHWDLVEADA
jgi:hypothetical protein